MRTIGALVAGVLLVAILAAILWPDPPNKVERDLAPFEAAVREYLAAKSFGMKPVRAQELSVDKDGRTAAAVYKLKDAAGTYDLAVTWTFIFERDEAGGWTVTGHETR